jgi:hypothetical protein
MVSRPVPRREADVKGVHDEAVMRNKDKESNKWRRVSADTKMKAEKKKAADSA